MLHCDQLLGSRSWLVPKTRYKPDFAFVLTIPPFKLDKRSEFTNQLLFTFLGSKWCWKTRRILEGTISGAREAKEMKCSRRMKVRQIFSDYICFVSASVLTCVSVFRG